MSIEIGQIAPDFNLPDENKKFHTLAEYKGKNVILFFFPAAWTGACTKEMCMVQEDFNSYSTLNAVPIGISVDTIFALKRFREDFKLDNVILLSDLHKETIKAYDVVNNGFSVGYDGVAMRSVFVIDKDGVVRYKDVMKAQGDIPDMDAVKNAVKSIG